MLCVSWYLLLFIFFSASNLRWFFVNGIKQIIKKKEKKVYKFKELVKKDFVCCSEACFFMYENIDIASLTHCRHRLSFCMVLIVDVPVPEPDSIYLLLNMIYILAMQKLIILWSANCHWNLTWWWVEVSCPADEFLTWHMIHKTILFRKLIWCHLRSVRNIINVFFFFRTITVYMHSLFAPPKGNWSGRNNCTTWFTQPHNLFHRFYSCSNAIGENDIEYNTYLFTGCD